MTDSVTLATRTLAFACLQLGFQRGQVMTTVSLSTLPTNAIRSSPSSRSSYDQLPEDGAEPAR